MTNLVANCANNAFGSVEVDVIPAPQAILTVGDPACFGDSVLLEVEFIKGCAWDYSFQYINAYSDTLSSSTSTIVLYGSESG